MKQSTKVKGSPMMIDTRWSVLSAPPLEEATSAMATMPSVKHQKTFCQMGILEADRPEAEMMSSVIEPESDEVRK